MIACPVCQKEIEPPARECPRCRADVGLLADHLDATRSVLADPALHPKADEFARTFATYLELFEADAGNADAKVALQPIAYILHGRPPAGSFGCGIVAAVGMLALLLGVTCGTLWGYFG